MDAYRQFLWSLPIDGAMISAPIIADINNDGYEDIIVVDTSILVYLIV